jgi:hypothetical protein
LLRLAPARPAPRSQETETSVHELSPGQTISPLPCPIDRVCHDRLRIDADTFADAAQNTNSDRDVIRELQRAGAPALSDAWFDPVRPNRDLHGDDS